MEAHVKSDSILHLHTFFSLAEKNVRLLVTIGGKISHWGLGLSEK